MIKKLIYILILIILCTSKTLAEPQQAQLDFDSYKYTFKPGDNIKFLKNANANFKLSEMAQTPADKVFYLQESMRYFYMLSQIYPKSVDAQVGLGRVYDELGIDRYAKKHFFTALDFGKKSARANFYFANYYFKRNDFIEALKYYKKAYEYGFSTNFETNCRLAIIYEKLADIESAKKYYINAYNLDKKHAELVDKIDLLDELNYSQSQYYLFKK